MTNITLKVFQTTLKNTGKDQNTDQGRIKTKQGI